MLSCNVLCAIKELSIIIIIIISKDIKIVYIMNLSCNF